MTEDDLLEAEGEAVPDDEDEDDEDWDDHLDNWDNDRLVPDQQWEDVLKVRGIRGKHPDLHLMKVTGYTATRFSQIAEWCEEFCTGQWKKIEWSGNCSYTVIVGFEKSIDAIYYKLRWL